MRKKVLMTWVLALCTMTTWGQTFDTEKMENPEKEISAIEQQWATKTLKVTNANPKARIWDFAKAFCSQYQDYVPNAAMMDYLKNPKAYSPDTNTKPYYVDDAPRNGYIKCDMLFQCDFMTELCYWRRTNGHSLVGVLMQVGHEGEGSQTDYSLLFYDFNPKTMTMTPDVKVYQKVEELIAKQKGTPSLRLPKEGKDITVVCVEWIGGDDDFRFFDVNLHWTGDTFSE